MARVSKKAHVAPASTTRKGRGGRKPGVWTLLTPEKLRDYRDRNRISRARLAAMLGVSSTSVQNWETGTVASTKIQQRLAELIAAGPPASVPPRKPPFLWDASSRSNAAVQATATIIVAYTHVQRDLPPDRLVDLVRAVRQALS